MTHSHIPILLEPIVESLTERFLKQPEPWIHVDCTLGGAGHFQAVLNRIKALAPTKKYKLIGIDQDPDAIRNASEKFRSEIQNKTVELFHSRFSDFPKVVGEQKIDSLLADLGFSSIQMDDPSRGLSFRSDGPLDMRLDPSAGEPLKDWIPKQTEEFLGEVLKEYGEERFWKNIAQGVFRAFRSSNPPSTPAQLANVIVNSLPPPARKPKGIHPATRSFQAFRIALNEELEELDKLLDNGMKQLKTGGRVAIISFHSLEDRRVKWFFKNRGDQFQSLSKKPIIPSDQEQELNPRSRSAKLRVLERLGDE